MKNATHQRQVLENRLLAGVEWRDLVAMNAGEKVCELFLPLPWLLACLFSFHCGHILLGAICSFYFFLTGLRQSHGAQHYSLGIRKTAQDAIMLVLSVLMLASMHAVQVSHLHHHRHCLQEDDAEGSTARLSWWRALFAGPLFPTRIHVAAWQLASVRKRFWIAAELAGILVVVVAALALDDSLALRCHVAAMLAGECFTGFFAVWTVHHGCEQGGELARTQRGRWINRFCYNMFFHAEHHLFPAVPTCHLSTLAMRLDALTPAWKWKQVLGHSGSSV